MKNKTQNLTEEEIIRNEQPVTAKEILEEIFPLLGDYFFGELSFENESITYCMPNGQKFILTAAEA